MRSVLSVLTRHRLMTVLAVLLIVGVAASVGAQIRPWEQLGSREIDGNIDHDTIKCKGKETFTALQFRVTGPAVHFLRIQVEYGNHETRAYPFQVIVPPNGSSPALDLAGGHRDITKVEFWYEKASFGKKKPEVRLYGRR